MSAIRDALVAHLQADATLTALLGAGAAGVFSTPDRPAGVSLPAVQVMGSASHTGPIDGDGLFEVVRPLRVLGDETGDDAIVDAAAERVRALFEPPLSTGFAVAGHVSGGIAVDGPVELDPDADSYGRVVNVVMRLEPA